MATILDQLESALSDAVRSRCPELGPDTVLLLATIGRPAEIDMTLPAPVRKELIGDFVDCLPQAGSQGFVPDTDLFTTRYGSLLQVAHRRQGLADDVGAVVDQQISSAHERFDKAGHPRLTIPETCWDTTQDPDTWYDRAGSHWQPLKVSEGDPAPTPQPSTPPRPPWVFRLPPTSTEGQERWERLGIGVLANRRETLDLRPQPLLVQPDVVSVRANPVLLNTQQLVARPALAMVRLVDTKVLDAAPPAQVVAAAPVATEFSVSRQLALSSVLTQVIADSTPVAPTSSSFTIELSCAVVSLTRDWLDTAWWSNPWWEVPGEQSGSWSAGDVSAAGQLIAAVPVAMVVVKDVNITATWSEQDSAQLATMPPALGPFALHSATFASGVLSIPGVQVVAWMCKVPPVLPPALPDQPSITDSDAPSDPVTPAGTSDSPPAM